MMPSPPVEKVCEACGSGPVETKLVRTTNGSLRICEQCLSDINRKSPLLIAERDRADKLQAFKDFVHRRLDEAGVPKEFPNGPHSREGCRIGDRLDWLFKKSSLPEKEGQR